MVDIEKVKIIVQQKTWKLLMLSMPKALQLRKNPIGCSICLFSVNVWFWLPLNDLSAKEKATKMQVLFPELRNFSERFTHTHLLKMSF